MTHHPRHQMDEDHHPLRGLARGLKSLVWVVWAAALMVAGAVVAVTVIVNTI